MSHPRFTFSLFAVLVGMTLASSAFAVRFDFGNGSVDSNTGAAANFVIAEDQPFGASPGNQSLTLEGIELAIAPIVDQSTADFSMSTWGANTQGIGIRSLDAGGGFVSGEGANGGQRRRINGNTGEAIQFSFDTTVVIDSLRLGSLAPSDNSGSGDIETAEISFFSGVDPFGGSSFTFDSDSTVNTSPIEDLPVGVVVEAGTVLSLSSPTPIASGVLWNDIVVSLPPADPLTLQVFTDTGEMRIVNNSTEDFAIDRYDIVSADIAEDGGSLNAAGFTGLAGAAGFPAGNNDGTGWESADNNDDLEIVELYLLGDSTIATTDSPVSLGNAFVPGATEDLTFTYHLAGTGAEEITGAIEYLTAGGQAGDFDGDGDVDGTDFLLWQRTDGSSTGLSDWENSYGTPGGSLSAVATVPEPNTLLLCTLSLLRLATIRNRRQTRWQKAQLLQLNWR